VPPAPAAGGQAVGPAALPPQQATQLNVVLERAYMETPTTCDTFTTRGVISQQPQAQPPQMLMPGMPMPAPPALPLIATLEVTAEGWESNP
jgi:hypothetical protein